MGLEITRDHRRKMGEAGSSTGPVVQLCGSPRDLKPGFGALGVGEQRVGELGESQEYETEDWSQGLKLINWVRPNDKDEDEGKGNGRGTGRRWRHFGDDGGTSETMEALWR